MINKDMILKTLINNIESEISVMTKFIYILRKEHKILSEHNINIYEKNLDEASEYLSKLELLRAERFHVLKDLSKELGVGLSSINISYLAEKFIDYKKLLLSLKVKLDQKLNDTKAQLKLNEELLMKMIDMNSLLANIILGKESHDLTYDASVYKG